MPDINEGLTTGDDHGAPSLEDVLSREGVSHADLPEGDTDQAAAMDLSTPHLASSIAAGLTYGNDPTRPTESVKLTPEEEASMARYEAQQQDAQEAVAYREATRQQAYLDIALFGVHTDTFGRTTEAETEADQAAAWGLVSDATKAKAIADGWLTEVDIEERAENLGRIEAEQGEADRATTLMRNAVLWQNMASELTANGVDVAKYETIYAGEMGQLSNDPDERLQQVLKAAALDAEWGKAESDANFKWALLTAGGSVHEGLEVGGRQIADRPDGIELRPDPARAAARYNAGRNTSDFAKAVRANVYEPSPAAKGLADIQKVAGKLFADSAARRAAGR